MFKWLTDKRRKKGATRPITPGAIQLSIVPAGGELLPCHISYLNPEGGVISFPAKDHPGFRLNQKIGIKLSIDEPFKESMLDAIVARSERIEGERVCRIEFIKQMSMNEELNAAYLSGFNRRRAFRVSTTPDHDVKVRIEREGGIALGRLIDISAIGIGIGQVSAKGIRLDVGVEEGIKFDLQDRLSLFFQLPGYHNELRTAGIIRYRRVTGKNFRVGITFDWAETEDSQQQEAAIVTYVMRQQQSMLERSAWIRRAGRS